MKKDVIVAAILFLISKCRMYDGALTGLEDKEKIRRRSLSIDVSFILDLKIGL